MAQDLGKDYPKQVFAFVTVHVAIFHEWYGILSTSMSVPPIGRWGGGGATGTICPGPPVSWGPQTVLNSFR